MAGGACATETCHMGPQITKSLKNNEKSGRSCSTSSTALSFVCDHVKHQNVPARPSVHPAAATVVVSAESVPAPRQAPAKTVPPAANCR